MPSITRLTASSHFYVTPMTAYFSTKKYIQISSKIHHNLQEDIEVNGYGCEP